MKSWFPKGQQRIIKTYGKHESVKLVGVLNYEAGRIDIEETEKWDAEVFLQFLNKTLAWYPKGNIVMVANPRLSLMFLPPYSPMLNIIEGLWGWLKDTCINNVFFAKFYQVKLAIRKFVKLVNLDRDQVIARLCVQL